MKAFPLSKLAIEKLLQTPSKTLSTRLFSYPSRGQSSKQELYTLADGRKFFLKAVSERNHQECGVDPKSGTLAEREIWATKVAHSIGLFVPPMVLIDANTTLQQWLNIPDMNQLMMAGIDIPHFDTTNIFECALFDWIIGQHDRHEGNYLFDVIQRKIIIIDSAYSFLSYEPPPPHYLNLAKFQLTTSQMNLSQKNNPVLVKAQKLKVKFNFPKKDSEILNFEKRIAQLNKITSIKTLIELYE